MPFPRVQLAALGVAVLIALVYRVGFPLLITLADIAAIASLALLVYMTAADGFSKASREARRERRSPV